MSDGLTRAQIKELVNNHIARDLARSDPDFVGVARSARYAEAEAGLLAASIGAGLAGDKDLPEVVRLVVARNRLRGVTERVEGFSEVPTMAIAGHNASMPDQPKAFANRALKMKPDGGDEPNDS